VTASSDARREALATRVVVADGAMGAMLQAQDPSRKDFQQLEGCNEVLNVTRPYIVRSVHSAYFDLDLCLADMAELAGRFATTSTHPIVLDSTEVDVIRAGLEKLGGRAVITSVNYEDGDGPESRFAKVTALAQEHGATPIALTIDEEGEARAPEKKVAIAERLIDDLTSNWGVHEWGILTDTLTSQPLEPGRIGIRLSEEFQLRPEQSTDAIVVHRPEAKYFNAGGNPT
jgi:cobalamin-dependent methionine synthase I